VEVLRQAMTRSADDHETHIPLALQQLRCAESMAMLCKLLTSSKPGIRRSAVKALGNMRSRDNLPAIHEMLGRERDAETKQEAARALMIISDESSTRPLLAAMLGERDEAVLTALGKALSKITGKDLPASYERWRSYVEQGK